MDFVRKIWNRIPLKLLLLVSLLSQIVGQCHPFSRFPMYSSFPPSADIYYVTDGANKLIPTVPVLGLFAPELKQRIEHQYETYGQNWGNDSLLAQASKAVLLHIVEERTATLKEQGVRNLSLRRVVLSRSAAGLQKKESEVAAWP